jgi:protein involved in ribonucleotide reduction
MLVFFSSTTENTARFIEKLDVPAQRIPLMAAEAALFTVEEDFVLVTPTYGQGRVPPQVVKFLNLEQNRVRCKGVIGSGNMNFHGDYAKAADIISAKLQVPVLYRFELAGTQDDITKTHEGLNNFWQKSPLKAPEN